MEANWSDLPVDILCLFADRLLGIEDFVRFGAVCTSWRLAATEVKKKNQRRPFTPWLMHAELENDDAADTEMGIRRCFSLSSGQTFHLRLPVLQGRRCWGTNFGWLFTFGLDGEIFLFNPLTGATIPLPSQRNFPPQPTDFKNNREHICQGFIRAVALSSDPSEDLPGHPLTVMVSFGGFSKLAFASPGEQVWKFTQTNKLIMDIIVVGDWFICVAVNSVFQLCHTAAAPPHTVDVTPAPQHMESDYPRLSYLVITSDKLYLIIRSYEKKSMGGSDRTSYHKFTRRFSAYIFNTQKKCWGPRCEHLEGYALFLGNNQSFALSPSDYPELKPDCIYYTDNHCMLHRADYSDMGIYDYKTCTIDTRLSDNWSHQTSQISRSLFFMPRLS